MYKLAFGTAMEIFEITRGFPSEERYSLIDQIRRSSRSVCSNTAEAYRKRRYEAAFVAKLSDAESEAAETQVWVEFALKCGYITENTANKIYKQYDNIIGKLITMMNNPGKWTL